MEPQAAPVSAGKNRRKRKSASPVKTMWRKLREPIARSRAAKQALASVMAAAVRLIARTNPPVAGSHDPTPLIGRHSPAIVALWHGQHIMAPAIRPDGLKMTALFSRSADAELNALVAEKLGFGIVRGSGGRGGRSTPEKGGARALIALKRLLDAGENVAMIADISHGNRREAGLGIVTLARFSGRPIIPVAVATSRRRVIERSWDKTTINLPFGRRALIIGEPICVAADASAEDLEARRAEVTEALNAATAEAYRLVGGVA